MAIDCPDHNPLATNHANTCLGAFVAVVRDRNDSLGQREQARALFEEWLRLMASFPGAVAAAAQQPEATATTGAHTLA